MAEKHIDTSFLDKAIHFAVDAHQGVERRGKGFPFIVHPLEVVSIASTMSSDQEVLAAAVLHDTVEDTPVTLEEIASTFSPRVAHMVDIESDCLDGAGKLSWRERKARSMARIAAADRDSQIVALSDKLANMRAIARDYRIEGDALWRIFREKERSAHEWHYRTLASSLKNLSGTVAYEEFVSLVEEVFPNENNN